VDTLLNYPLIVIFLASIAALVAASRATDSTELFVLVDGLGHHLDEAAGLAYVTTHRENTIDRVRLAHDGNREGRTVIAGDPFTETLVGPSAGAWGRAQGKKGRVAYFTSDGGTAQPPDGVYRKAKVLRVELPPVG
jgi:hypothetical protein